MGDQADILEETVETKAELVRLKELVSVSAGMRCEYLVDREKGRTQLHLFLTPNSPTPVTVFPKMGDVLRDILARVFGQGIKTEWVPEVASWYVEVPRVMPDDGTIAATALLKEMPNQAHAGR